MTRIALCILVALFSAPTWALDWQQQLKKDIVTKTKGKMAYDAVELCTVAAARKNAQPTTMQVKIHSEAPTSGFISRDNFVALTVATQGALTGGADCKTLEALIGNPDLEINIFMATGGLQIEVNNTATGQKERTTTQWKDLFAD